MISFNLVPNSLKTFECDILNFCFSAYEVNGGIFLFMAINPSGVCSEPYARFSLLSPNLGCSTSTDYETSVTVFSFLLLVGEFLVTFVLLIFFISFLSVMRSSFISNVSLHEVKFPDDFSSDLPRVAISSFSTAY